MLMVGREGEAIPDDIPGVEMSRAGAPCRFDIVLKKCQWTEPALHPLTVIVHGADTVRLGRAP